MWHIIKIVGFHVNRTIRKEGNLAKRKAFYADDIWQPLQIIFLIRDCKLTGQI